MSDINEALKELYDKMEKESVDLDPELQKIIFDNLWDLYDE